MARQTEHPSAVEGGLCSPFLTRSRPLPYAATIMSLCSGGLTPARCDTLATSARATPPRSPWGTGYFYLTSHWSPKNHQIHQQTSSGLLQQQRRALSAVPWLWKLASARATSACLQRAPKPLARRKKPRLTLALTRAIRSLLRALNPASAAPCCPVAPMALRGLRPPTLQRPASRSTCAARPRAGWFDNFGASSQEKKDAAYKDQLEFLAARRSGKLLTSAEKRRKEVAGYMKARWLRASESRPTEPEPTPHPALQGGAAGRARVAPREPDANLRAGAQLADEHHPASGTVWGPEDGCVFCLASSPPHTSCSPPARACADNGERWDLKAKYTDEGYVDEDSDVLAKVRNFFGGGKK